MPKNLEPHLQKKEIKEAKTERISKNCYLISKDWWELWKKFVNFEEENEGIAMEDQKIKPPPINNFNLLYYNELTLLFFNPFKLLTSL